MHGQASAGRRRFEVRAGRAYAHARALRHPRGLGRVRGIGARIPQGPPPGRDLHGSPDARHGRPAGGAGNQGQSRARRHPDHDVHVPGGRDLRRAGPRLGRHRRAAEVHPPDRRHEGALPAAAPAGPPRRRVVGARTGRRPRAGGVCAAGGRDARARAIGGGAAQGAEPRAAEVRRRLARRRRAARGRGTPAQGRSVDRGRRVARR